jgi:uncharacterized protein involved in exopolysaccharide biosynthesis
VEQVEDSFVPLASLRIALRFWWLVFLLAAAGGGAGWLAARFQPPVYEAVAHFSTSIDYISTGPLTQFEEDTAINVVGDVILSGRVLKPVIEKAAAEGIQTSVVELKKSTVLERRVNVWDLRVRNTDAQAAERLANLWVEQGQATLLEAYRHSLQADRLNRYLESLESCLAKAAASEPGSGQCSKTRFGEIQQDLQATGKMFSQERLASLGLFSGLLIGPIEPVSAAAGPVLYNRNQMVLAGSFIGLLVGIVLVQLVIPARLTAGRPGKKPGRS